MKFHFIIIQIKIFYILKIKNFFKKIINYNTLKKKQIIYKFLKIHFCKIKLKFKICER